MLKGQNRKVKSGAKTGYSNSGQVCSNTQETYSSSRKTYSKKKSCFTLSGVRSVGLGACSVSAGVCFSTLLALGFVALNPTANSVNALTSTELESGSLTSSVSISFAPASGSTTLSPTSAAGTSGLISVLANVGVTNSGGYSVYLGGNSTNLVGKNTNNSIVIPGVSGEVEFNNLHDKHYTLLS